LTGNVSEPLTHATHMVNEGHARPMNESCFADPGFLKRLKLSDEAAVAQLVDIYLPHLLRAARGMGFSREEAEDLSQSAFTAMLEALGRFEGRSHIRTFLFGIFYNKVSEHMREKKRSNQNDPIDAVMEARFHKDGRWLHPPADFEKQLHAKEMKTIILESLQELPAAQRMAFYMREIEEMAMAEICSKMRISANHLSVLLFRARNRLREILEVKISGGGGSRINSHAILSVS
jgi:RNA polymerase sigma-70 factor, ECF subfamily